LSAAHYAALAAPEELLIRNLSITDAYLCRPMVDALPLHELARRDLNENQPLLQLLQRQRARLQAQVLPSLS